MDSLFADFSALSSMSGEKAEKNMQEALNYLGLDMRNIARTMRPYHPLEMLKMAAWEERRVARLKGDDEFQKLYAHLLPVLTQSVLQSTLYDTSYPASTNRDIKQKDWNRLLSLAEDAAKRLLKYIESYAVYAVRSGAVSEENAESYRETILRQFFPPEESRDSIEKHSCLWYGYAIDDEKVIEEKFGTELRPLLSGLEKIAEYGLEGIDKLTEDFSVYKAEMLLLMARKRAEGADPSLSDDELRDEIVHENKWEMRVKDLQGRRDDFDLFRPEFAADLPSDVYEVLSCPIGSVDIDEYLRKGLWPATVYPFIRFGSMHFSFVQSHILSYGQRILAINAGLYLRDSAAASAACRLLFSETDTVGVYSFDGNKVDISILSSIREVNAVENPAFYESRVRSHAEDRNARARDGHKLLILDPDSDSPLEKISDSVFSSSVYYLIKSANTEEGREEFHRTIFGALEFPEKTEILDYLDEDDIDDKEVIDDVDDEISDEYEYDSEDDDEKARVLEEKERALDEAPIPEYRKVTPCEEELRKLQDRYRLTSEIIRRDEESDAEADEYERELDNDDYSYDEGDVLPPEDDEEIEDEELYDEVEKDDLYQSESSYDADQADLFDGLFDNPEEESEAELETEAESIEEEAEYEKEEEEASAFASDYEKELEHREAAPMQPASDDYVPTEIDEAESIQDNAGQDAMEMAGDDEAEAQDDDTVPDEASFVSETVAGPSEVNLMESEEAEGEPEAQDQPEAFEEESEETPLSEPADDADSSPEENPMDEDEEDAKAYIPALGEAFNAEPDEEREDDSVSSSASLPAEDADSDPSFEEEPMEDDEIASSASMEAPAEEEEPGSPSGEIMADPDEGEEPFASDEGTEDPVSDFDEDNEDTEEAGSTEAEDSGDVSDMADRGVKRVEDSSEGSVFVMVGNGEGSAADDFSDLSGLVREIALKVGPGSAFVDFVRSSDPDMLSYLEGVIGKSLERQGEDGKDKMFSIFDYSLSILIAAPKGVMDDIRREEILNNAGAVMYSRHSSSWNALILSFDGDGILQDAEERKITPSSFSPSNWKICRIVGEQLIARGSSGKK